jgi:hypothetical protein
MEQVKKAALTVNIIVAAYMFNFIRVNANIKNSSINGKINFKDTNIHFSL